MTVHATDSQFVYDLLYFWGWGAAASFLFADTGGANWNTWHFYQYFISHGFTLLTMTWFAAVRGHRPTIRSLFHAVAILFPLSLGIHLLDVSFQTRPGNSTTPSSLRPLAWARPSRPSGPARATTGGSSALSR